MARGLRRSSGHRISAKNAIILVAFMALFVVPAFFSIPTAKAVTTTNCTTVNGVPTATCTQTAGGVANSWGNGRRVFYTSTTASSGVWWVFWGATIGATTGIYYQSCLTTAPTGCSTSGAWSAPAIFSSATSNLDGWLFDAVLGTSGNNLFYVLAQAAVVQNFYWGEVNLPNTGVI